MKPVAGSEEGNKLLEERQKQIQRNKERLRELGLEDPWAIAQDEGFDQVVQDKEEREREERQKRRRAEERRAQKREKKDVEPVRRSTRNQGKQVDYTGGAAGDVEAGTRKKAPKPRGERKRAAAPKAANQEDHTDSKAVTEAKHRAIDWIRDHARGVETEKKKMLGSMVSGGFWCQGPPSFTSYLPQDEGPVMLKYGRGTWPCNWLGLKRRGTGGGFSAGWRGFAIENELSVGDYVVYDLLEVKTGEVPIIEVQIFRWRDYATGEVGAGIQGHASTSGVGGGAGKGKREGSSSGGSSSSESSSSEESSESSESEESSSGISDGDQGEPDEGSGRGEDVWNRDGPASGTDRRNGRGDAARAAPRATRRIVSTRNVPARERPPRTRPGSPRRAKQRKAREVAYEEEDSGLHNTWEDTLGTCSGDGLLSGSGVGATAELDEGKGQEHSSAADDGGRDSGETSDDSDVVLIPSRSRFVRQAPAVPATAVERMGRALGRPASSDARPGSTSGRGQGRKRARSAVPPSILFSRGRVLGPALTSGVDQERIESITFSRTGRAGREYLVLWEDSPKLWDASWVTEQVLGDLAGIKCRRLPERAKQALLEHM